MKIIFTLLVSTLAFCVNAQESLKKYYQVPKKIGDIYLMKELIIKYDAMTSQQKDTIQKLYPLGSKRIYTYTKTINGKEAVFQDTIRIDSNFYKQQTIKKEVKEEVDHKANVKFDKDKIIVNSYLKNEKNVLSRYPIMFYKLKNRQSVSLNFKEFTVSTLNIPLKYRFKNDKGRKEEFSTGFNGNIFFGISTGWTRFFYREQVDNISNTTKFTLGVLVGASTTTLNSSNTSLSSSPLAGDTEITKGLASIGAGFTYSFNKINLGVFIGRDNAVGNNAAKWNYNKKPWLGIAIGFSIFSL